ncbi:MAG: Ser-Thr-rich GPI-anchored membrane family protein [Promethearchaeota archaeon]
MKIKMHKKLQVIMFSCVMIIVGSLTCILSNDTTSVDEELQHLRTSDSVRFTNPISSNVIWEVGSTQRFEWNYTGDERVLHICIVVWGGPDFFIAEVDATQEFFAWEVTAPFGYKDSYYFIIRDYYEPPDVYDFSATICIAPPAYIEIVEPDVLSSWHAGSTQSITWWSQGTISSVNINLYHWDVYHSTIASNTENDGSHSWTLEDNYESYGNGYQIRIEDASDPWNTFSVSPRFEIKPPPNTISVTNPGFRSSWQAGSTQKITWTSTGNISEVNIRLYYSGTFLDTIARNTPNNGVFSWTLASSYANYGDLYQIRIEDASNLSCHDFSYPYFEITPLIRITNPTGSSSWQAGSTQNITWIATDSITNVNIKLYLMGMHVVNIAFNTPNDGCYSWNLASSYLFYADLYQIRIEDSSNPDYFDITPNFEITDPSRGNITVTSPTSLSSWQAGSIQKITWTSTGNISEVNIELWYLGSYLQTIASNVSNDGSHSWMLASSYASYADSYQIRIIDYHDPNVYGYSPKFFQITAQVVVDTITVTSPTSSSSWQAGSTQNITWTSTGNISEVNIHLYYSGTYLNTIARNTTNDGTFSWTLASSYANYGDLYQIRIEDASNLSCQDFSYPYFAITLGAGSRVISETEPIVLIGTFSLGIIVGMMSLGFISFKKKHRK